MEKSSCRLIPFIAPVGRQEPLNNNNKLSDVLREQMNLTFIVTRNHKL